MSRGVLKIVVMLVTLVLVSTLSSYCYATMNDGDCTVMVFA